MGCSAPTDRLMPAVNAGKPQAGKQYIQSLIFQLP